jgi:hypothetical protein
MSRAQPSRVGKELMEVIEREGATVVTVRAGAKHFLVDYTFDHHRFFTTSLPKGKIGDRFLLNFRASIRQSRRQLGIKP